MSSRAGETVSEVQLIDRQIQAIKNSTEYRRLITSSRGMREEQELKKLNIQIETLEYRKAEAMKKQKPAASTSGALRLPSGKNKGTQLMTKSVIKEQPKVVPQRRILTFAPNRPKGLQAPRGPQTRVLTPAAAHMPAGHGATKGAHHDEDLNDMDADPPVPAPITQNLKKNADRPKLRTARNTKAPPKASVAVLRDNIRELEAELEDLTEEI